jgi:hypothetical protein
VVLFASLFTQLESDRTVMALCQKAVSLLEVLSG